MILIPAWMYVATALTFLILGIALGRSMTAEEE